MKNGKEVPDCKKEGKFDLKANMRRKNETQYGKQQARHSTKPQGKAALIDSSEEKSDAVKVSC